MFGYFLYRRRVGDAHMAAVSRSIGSDAQFFQVRCPLSRQAFLMLACISLSSLAAHVIEHGGFRKCADGDNLSSGEQLIKGIILISGRNRLKNALTGCAGGKPG